jgi:5'-methylthioadenosine phosphorylase
LTRITKVEQSNNWHVARHAFEHRRPPGPFFDCQSMLAIIGGSGLTRLSTLAVALREVVRTPYGEPSSALLYGQIAGRDVIFLARHGHGHTIPPHRVNYRANLWALKERGASAILAVASVGGIAPAYRPGDLVLPHQLLDYTSGRETTFFDGSDRVVIHVDFTEPYSQPLRGHCLAAAVAGAIAVRDGGVYAAVSGPRLETAAEIDRLERDGATMVGMTGMPEAALARELGVDYAAIAVVVNQAAGRGDSAHAISMASIADVLETAMDKVRSLIDGVVGLVP